MKVQLLKKKKTQQLQKTPVAEILISDKNEYG